MHNEAYCRKVVPFLKTEYFSDHFEKVVAQELVSFFTQYNKPASLDILAIQLGKRVLIGMARVDEHDIHRGGQTCENFRVEVVALHERPMLVRQFGCWVDIHRPQMAARPLQSVEPGDR